MLLKFHDKSDLITLMRLIIDYIHNVEFSSDSPHARKQDDIVKVTSILKDHLAIKCSITNAVRLGKKTQRTNPRLLKVIVSS